MEAVRKRPAMYIGDTGTAGSLYYAISGKNAARSIRRRCVKSRRCPSGFPTLPQCGVQNVTKTGINGRRKGEPKHIRHYEWMLASSAYRSLSCYARCLLVELYRRYNGGNNGEISMSVREAAELLGCNKDTALKAFRELEERGFIKSNVKGAFTLKERHATTWILPAPAPGILAAARPCQTGAAACTVAPAPDRARPRARPTSVRPSPSTVYMQDPTTLISASQRVRYGVGTDSTARNGVKR